MDFYKEIENTYKIANKEIAELYQKYKNNKKFNKFDSDIKKKWYYKNLKQRIQNKIYIKYNLTLFRAIEEVINKILPDTINTQFNNFVDINNVYIGDENKWIKNHILNQN